MDDRDEDAGLGLSRRAKGWVAAGTVLVVVALGALILKAFAPNFTARAVESVLSTFTVTITTPPPAATLLKLLWPGVAQPVFAAVLDGVSTAAPGSSFDPATFVPPLFRLRQPALPEALHSLPAGLRPADNPVELDVAVSGLSSDRRMSNQ